MEPVTINGFGPFYDKPTICGYCQFYSADEKRRCGGKGFCVLFSVRKNYYDNVPKRCNQMFDAAFRIGGDVVLVEKDNNSNN